MKRLQAFKYELQPNGEQTRFMRRFAGSCRFVFNKALAMQKAIYEGGEKKLGYAGLCKTLTEWRNSTDTAWLADAPVHPLQQTLKDLERAYTNFFAKRADFPRFKKKGQHDSFRYPDAKQFKIDQANSRIFLPKLGWIRYRNSRDILGAAKNITVSANGSKWFVSIQTERAIVRPVHPSTSSVGIDVGISRFATLSDGSHIEPLNTFRKHQQRLARYQRAMSRKTKFSSNWKKAKARVQKIHTRIAHVRKDFLHKTTTTISKHHAIVCIEDLQVRNMSKSAAGSSDSPGRNVKAKSGLNKSILDQGWFEFRRQLDYKAQRRGGQIVVAERWFPSSKTCSCCGVLLEALPLSVRQWTCGDCGAEHDRDMNAAKNLERYAVSSTVSACGGEGAGLGRTLKVKPFPLKQEPNGRGELCLA